MAPNCTHPQLPQFVFLQKKKKEEKKKGNTSEVTQTELWENGAEMGTSKKKKTTKSCSGGGRKTTIQLFGIVDTVRRGIYSKRGSSFGNAHWLIGLMGGRHPDGWEVQWKCRTKEKRRPIGFSNRREGQLLPIRRIFGWKAWKLGKVLIFCGTGGRVVDTWVLGRGHRRGWRG